jgi:hypothetical protein
VVALGSLDVKKAVFWVVPVCSLVKVYRRFTSSCCIHHHGDKWRCKKRLPSETSANFYQTTDWNNPEDSRIYICGCENVKSHSWVSCANTIGGERLKFYEILGFTVLKIGIVVLCLLHSVFLEVVCNVTTRLFMPYSTIFCQSRSVQWVKSTSWTVPVQYLKTRLSFTWYHRFHVVGSRDRAPVSGMGRVISSKTRRVPPCLAQQCVKFKF